MPLTLADSNLFFATWIRITTTAVNDEIANQLAENVVWL